MCKISVNSPLLILCHLLLKLTRYIHVGNKLAFIQGITVWPFVKWLGCVIPSVDGLCVKFTDRNDFQLINNPCTGSIACIVLVFLMCNLVVKSTNINKYTVYAELLPFRIVSRIKLYQSVVYL